MTCRRKRICLVTSAHISYNPRVVKEADTLARAGYDVSVIALTLDDSKMGIDSSMARKRLWAFRSIDVRRNRFPAMARWLSASLRQFFYRKLLSKNSSQRARDRAYSRYLGELCGLLQFEKADLYIAHNLPALPAAAAAARAAGAKLGFDAEDYHRGEFRDTDSVDYCLTKNIEEYYVPRCDYLTAASDGIADAYVEALKVRRPITILNVFSNPCAVSTTGVKLEDERAGEGLSLYWYSQTIGRDRGLGDALEAIRLLPSADLHIRGTWSAGYQRIFMDEVVRLAIADRVHVHSPVPPQELIARAEHHDVGLALEPGDRPNNRIAASNKLFTYLSAGLAVAATDVPGQAHIFQSIGGAGFLYPPGQGHLLAAGLQRWIDDPAKLAAAKQAAKDAGESRYCWDIESERLTGAVKDVLKNK
jgi:glycosyltransferase involved in cell wall biosynthesis